MFNLSGSEVVVILLLALVVLGPEKLPDAIRRFGRMYGELKRMSNSFQDEMRSTLDEPMREMRETADLLREQATFDADKVDIDADTGARGNTDGDTEPASAEPDSGAEPDAGADDGDRTEPAPAEADSGAEPDAGADDGDRADGRAETDEDGSA